MLCLSLMLVPWTGRALAANGTPPVLERRVLLVVDKPNDPFIERIRAEIAGLGLAVLMRPAAPIPLEAAARQARAVAAVRILPSRKGVEVWMADETSGRSLLRQLVVDEKPEGPDQTVVALQTAEVIRTGLFPKEDTSNKQPAAASIALPAPTPEPAPTTVTGVQAGFGTLYAAGGAALQVSLALRRWWGPRWGAGVFASLPVRGTSVHGPEGTADVRSFLAGGDILASFQLGSPRWVLVTGAGAVLARVSTKGSKDPDTSLISASSSAETLALVARVEVATKPTPWSRLGLSTLAGLAPSPVRINFAGNEAETWGPPLLAAHLFAELDWD